MHSPSAQKSPTGQSSCTWHSAAPSPTDPIGVDHPANTYNGVTYTAEVLNLTREIVIEGTPTGRTHVHVSSTADHLLAYYEVRHFGPRQGNDFVQGRYATHFHGAGAFATPKVVTGAVAHLGGSHSFVTHLTDAITLDRCVAHDVVEIPFWWDKSGFGQPPAVNTTNDIRWEHCVASLVRPGSEAIQNAGFALGKGDGCAAVDCVAVGVRGGKSSGGFSWQEKQGVPSDPWGFDGNIAHNNERHGIFWWQNNEHDSIVDNFVAYNNGKAGANIGAYGNGVSPNNFVAFGNESGLTLHAHGTAGQDPFVLRPQVWTDSIFDGGIVKEPSQLAVGPEGPPTFNNCKVIAPVGKTCVELLVRSNPGLADGLAFAADTVFLQSLGGPLAAEADVFYAPDDAHPDFAITLWHAGTHWEITNKASGVGTFYAPWNANRTDIT